MPAASVAIRMAIRVMAHGLDAPSAPPVSLSFAGEGRRGAHLSNRAGRHARRRTKGPFGPGFSR
jgi:hypothetical protein